MIKSYNRLNSCNGILNQEIKNRKSLAKGFIPTEILITFYVGTFFSKLVFAYFIINICDSES